MKINSFRVVAVAAAVVATSGALAINISSTTVSPIYASEMLYTSAAPIASQVASAVLGFGIGSSQQRYIRVDVANASFADVVSNTNSPLTDTGASMTSSSWVSGGASGTSSAIFQVTASAAGQSPVDVLRFELPRLVVTSNSSPVTATYSLFETAGNAVANAGALATATGTIARFAQGLAGTIATGTARATVSSSYMNWAATAGSGPANTAALGTITFGVSASAPNIASGSTVALTDFLGATGHTLSVAGDFSAAVSSGVYLGSAASGGLCTALTPPAIFTLDSAKTTASLTIPGFATSAPWGAVAKLCYTANGTTPIAVSTYTATPTLSFKTVASGVSGTQVAAATIGSVTRDGTTLQAPLVQTTTGYVSRIVLTNTGTTAAAYTMEVKAGPTLNGGSAVNSVTKNGSTSGSIPAGGQAIIEGTSMPEFATTARGYAVFSISGTNDAVNGVYQITNIATGSISNMPLVRPASAYGTQP